MKSVLSFMTIFSVEEVILYEKKFALDEGWIFPPFQKNGIFCNSIQLEHSRLIGITILRPNDDGIVCFASWKSGQTFVNN